MEMLQFFKKKARATRILTIYLLSLFVFHFGPGRKSYNISQSSHEVPK